MIKSPCLDVSQDISLQQQHKDWNLDQEKISENMTHLFDDVLEMTFQQDPFQHFHSLDLNNKL